MLEIKVLDIVCIEVQSPSQQFFSHVETEPLTSTIESKCVLLKDTAQSSSWVQTENLSVQSLVTLLLATLFPSRIFLEYCTATPYTCSHKESGKMLMKG